MTAPRVPFWNLGISSPFHPILFAAYPILYLYTRNQRIFSFRDSFRSLELSLAVTVLLWLLLGLVTRSWRKAALIVTIWILLFFSVGHLATLVSAWIGSSTPSMVNLGFWVWLVAFAACPYFILKSRHVTDLTQFANVAGIVLFTMLLVINAQSFILKNRQVDQEASLLSHLRGGSDASVATAPPNPSSRPDIYYIILDSYEGAGALEKYYHFDNSAFLQALRARGFFIGSGSHSNYLNTSFSVSSSLNLIYLNSLPSSLLYQMTNSLKFDYARDFLRAQGYQMVTFQAGYGFLDNNLADIRISPHLAQSAAARASRSAPVNSFELSLFQTTAAGLAFSSGAVYLNTPSQEIEDTAFETDFAGRRERILSAFAHLPDFTHQAGSYFLYAHILSPHNPYLWNAQGEPLHYTGHEYLVGDKAHPERNIQLYTDQMQYTDQMALDMIDRILSQSETPPVIILQGDHGHDTYFEWTNPTEEGVDLRSTILNAYYFPNRDYSALYPTISPVNSFRVVFNQFFGTHFPILPDTTYYHNAEKPVTPGSQSKFVEYGPGVFPHAK